MKSVNRRVVYPCQLDKDTYERIKDFAAANDLSAAQVIRRALRKQLRELESQLKENPTSRKGFDERTS
jgi:hypothetical protein